MHPYEQALQDFLLDIDCLDELQSWTGKFNLFDILKVSRAEIRHSNMLAWLLNANENHGLGDAFIKGIFQTIVATDSGRRYDIFHLLLLDFHSFIIQREWRNIDLLAVSSEERTLLAIENKVGAHEHSNQLSRYREILEQAYPDYQKVFVYLTPEGEVPSDKEHWDSLTYEQVVDMLEDVCNQYEMVPDVKLLINNYIDVVRRDIVDDKQLIEICNKIYNKHKKALDLIYEYREDVKTKISDVTRDVLSGFNEKGLLIYNGDGSDSWIPFHTESMNRLLPPLENDRSSYGNRFVYNFFIERRPNYARAIFELGGWNVPENTMSVMQRMIDLTKPNDRKREGFKVKRLFSKLFELDDLEQDTIQSTIEHAVHELLSWEKGILKKMNL